MRGKISFSLLLAALAAFGSIARAQSGQVPCNSCPERRTIAVTGTGQVTLDADLAVVRVGYKLFGVDAKAAYDHAAQVSNAIMTALTSSGVPKSAIESTRQVLQHTQIYDLQQYPMGSMDREQRQFTVTQSWTIRVKPDQASATLDAAVGAGANESGWIQWIVADPSDAQAAASSDAVANARKVAVKIAERAGVSLGHVVSATENQGAASYNGPLNGLVSGSTFGMGDAVMLAGANQAMNQQLAINSRRVEFHSSVHVVFAIEEAAAK